jgi:hypothetical protein
MIPRSVARKTGKTKRRITFIVCAGTWENNLKLNLHETRGLSPRMSDISWKLTDVSEEHIASNIMAIWPWRWKRNFPPKRRLIFDELRGFISQKIGLFITTAVRTKNHISWRKAYGVPITVTARFKASTAFNTDIVGSNPTGGMDVYAHSFCVSLVQCVGSSLATGWSTVQGVLPTVY